jgi:predicted TIM-barrel fold metal-dependent hydrolase
MLDETAARAVGAFTESVGVCMHLGRVRTNYVQRFQEIERLLFESGIRHVRTDPVTAPQAVANVKRLAAAGVKFDFIIHPDGDRQTVAQLLENVMKNFSDCTELIEGLNEPDGRPEQAREWMAEMRRICQAHPVLEGILLGTWCC